MGQRLGIIAGSGELPFFILRETQKLGYTIAVAGIQEEAEASLKDEVDVFQWFAIDAILGIISFFKAYGITDAVFAGKIDHRHIYRKEGLKQPVLNLLSQGKDRSPSSLIRAAIDFLEKQGIKINDPTQFISSAFYEEGVLTEVMPSKTTEEDIAFGWEIARKLADLDVGQTVIVKDKAVVAVEGMEGTDEVIKRAGFLAGEGTVGIKVGRTHQDARIDLPAIGLNTVKSLVEARSKAFCFEAHKVPFFQKEEAVSLANEKKIAIVVKKG